MFWVVQGVNVYNYFLAIVLKIRAKNIYTTKVIYNFLNVLAAICRELSMDKKSKLSCA